MPYSFWNVSFWWFKHLCTKVDYKIEAPYNQGKRYKVLICSAYQDLYCMFPLQTCSQIQILAL